MVRAPLSGFGWLKHIANQEYACKACEETIQTAALPAQPIPKSNASPGLLAHIAVAKYQDALPLARQERILQRAGVDIPRATPGSSPGQASPAG